MPLPADSSPKLKDYAHPERLVTADWLASNLGRPGLAIVESDEDVLLYDIGHIPGAVKIDWHTDLNDPHVRDYIDGDPSNVIGVSLPLLRSLLGRVGLSVSTLWAGN